MRGGCSAVGYKPIAGHVVPDRMSERDGSAIIYGSSIDAAPLALGFAASLAKNSSRSAWS